MIKESDLYLPVKSFLEQQGYCVKAEVLDCDVLAIKEGMADLVVELKLSFSLELIFQALQRQKISDDVYVAIPAANTALKRKNWRAKQKNCVLLCKRLGIGLLLVDESNQVQVLQDPVDYKPSKNIKKRNKLVKEFVSRRGDPNKGGVNKTTIMTAYRQNALACAIELSRHGSMKVKDLKAATGVDSTSGILQNNYYAWFERISRGVYQLTEQGLQAVKDNAS